MDDRKAVACHILMVASYDRRVLSPKQHGWPLHRTARSRTSTELNTSSMISIERTRNVRTHEAYEIASGLNFYESDGAPTDFVAPLG
jgi:hypothetical protein